MTDFLYSPDGSTIQISGGIPRPRIKVFRARRLKPHKIVLYDSSNSDIEGHWETQWQDKWAAAASVAHLDSNITGKWERQWQDKWLPEYMNWLTPHPIPIEHSVDQANDPISGHGPERIISQLPDAVNYIDLSNPPSLKKIR